jgi:hypothetical protein
MKLHTRQQRQHKSPKNIYYMQYALIIMPLRNNVISMGYIH